MVKGFEQFPAYSSKTDAHIYKVTYESVNQRVLPLHDIQPSDVELSCRHQYSEDAKLKFV